MYIFIEVSDYTPCQYIDTTRKAIDCATTLSNSANCTVIRAVVLTQYRRVTDGRTDENAIASTALAMRALRRAVKTITGIC